MMSIFQRRHPVASCKNFRGIATFLLYLPLFTLLGSTVCEGTLASPTILERTYANGKYRLPHDFDFSSGYEDRQRFFEVSKPVEISPESFEACSQVILQQTFANTINLPPVVTQYQPVKNCRTDWDKVVLRWHATCRGRQFDRIAAVWLGGVEIFRTCTAEPTAKGIVWDVEKDITRYSSLLKETQSLVVSLANVVDNTYTGIYNVTISTHFYSEKKKDLVQESYGPVADLILPIAKPSPLQGGFWFQLQNESDIQTVTLKLPRNAYKAILEVCVSYHGDDEFWYTNPPEVYLKTNNLTGIPGNGTFREVIVFIDGMVAGAVFPFPVVYTGGIDPFFWRPAAAIGAFNLPSYDVDVTPFLGTLVDGKEHNFSMTVSNALSVWLLVANLHLWVDRSLDSTKGELFEYSAPMLSSTLVSDFKGLDGSFLTEASRSIAYKGYVESSIGNLTTSSSYSLKFSNLLVFTDESNTSVLHQDIKSESKVVVSAPSRDIAYDHSSYHFPLQLDYYQIIQPGGATYINASLANTWQQDIQSQTTLGPGRNSFNTLKNKQKSEGELSISPKGVISGEATTKQTYSYESTEGCYFRSLGVRNYTFLYDQSDTRCSMSS